MDVKVIRWTCSVLIDIIVLSILSRPYEIEKTGSRLSTTSAILKR